MLERATACLKSGATREALNCVQRVPRSKRMLHSTFWNHGAGDLDLPPWAVSMFPLPSDPPIKHDSTAKLRQSSEKSMQTELMRKSNSVFEGVFLDFLYPPQALAWLQRAKAQHWQRWERRNARRLPEEFIVASRGYASRSTMQNIAARPTNTAEEPDNAIGGEREETSEDAITNGGQRLPSLGKDSQHHEVQSHEHLMPQDTHTVSDSTVEYNPSWQNEPTPQDGNIEQDSDTSYKQGSQPNSSSDLEFGDSPSDLAERVISSLPSANSLSDNVGSVDAVQRLRTILSSRSSRARNSSEVTERAVGIYDSLDEESRNNPRLRRELMEWLSFQQNEMAQSRCMKLYRSIPKDERTFEVYQAALSVFLERNLFLMVSKLHEEALQNLENGHQISRTLFRHAVEQERWEVAIQAERAHHNRYAAGHMDINRASQTRVFWLHISEIPQLLQKAVQFAKYLRSDEKSRLRDGHTRQFAARFFKEAVSQEFLRRDGNTSFRGAPRNSTMPRKGIRTLFGYISELGEDAPKLFEDTLMEILRRDSGFHYPQLHEIVSFVYLKYRDMPGTRPPQALLMLWLERLTEHYDTLRLLKHTQHSFSLADLVREWKKHYEHPSKKAVKRLMTFYARSGRLEAYDRWLEYLRSVYPKYEDQKDILWTMIWVHARRADLDRAQQAFAEVKRTTTEHGDEPDIKCWNLLLHAHARADDLEGAFVNLQNLIDYSGLKPDKHSFHNVLEMLAKRGDVDGVENLLQQYDSIVKERRETAHLGSLLLAFVNNDDIQGAEKALLVALPRVRGGEIHGPLTGCFNIILTGHAMRRSIDATMRTYRWMKLEGVELDANSYAAVMQALVFYRRTQEAYGILKRVMPRSDIEPTAFHYAILIAGFVNNRQASNAIEVYNRMLQRNVKPTSSAHAAYLKAKAITETRQIQRRKLPNSKAVPLEETMKELKQFLRMNDGPEVAPKQPGLGFGTATLTLGEAPAAYFDFLIFVHGQRRCFEAVKALYQQYKEHAKKHGKGSDPAPIKMLASLAAASWRYGQHDIVEQCWQLAREQANDQAALIAVPQLKPRTAGNISADSALDVEPSAPNESPKSSVKEIETGSLGEQEPDPHKRAPARRHILTRVLRYYLLSLHSQGRTADAISTVTKIINQGYTMDNKTWNTFIETLCRTTPPLALLAYVLTERFLTPYFPGWSPTVAYPPQPEAVAEGLQYIKARYLSPGQLMPQYRTLVWLGGALLDLSKSLALSGGNSDQTIQPELRKYVGTLSSIRRHAPKTLFIVQSMPKIPDKLQSQVLGRESA